MKTLAGLIFCLTTSIGFSQKYTDTAYFDDGTAIPFYLESLNKIPPRINGIFCFFNPYIIGGDITMVMSGQGFYRPSEKSIIDIKIGAGFRMEPVVKENPNHKGQFNSTATYSYRFAHLEYNRKDAVILDAKPAGYDRTELYKYEFTAKKITNFYVSGGIDFSRYPHQSDLESMDSLVGGYEITNSSAVTLMGGIVRERHKYYAYSSEKLLRRRCYAYYRVRNYLYATYSPVINYSVSQFQVIEGGSPSTDWQYVPVSSGYIAPDVYNRIGWKFGSELKFQLNHFHNGIFMGIEFGKNYSLYSRDSEQGTGGDYFMIRFGMEISSKQ